MAGNQCFFFSLSGFFVWDLSSIPVLTIGWLPFIQKFEELFHSYFIVSRLKYLGCQKIQVEIRLALFSMKGILNHKQLHHKCGFGCLSKCKSLIFQGSKLCICTSNLCSMIHPIHAANPSNLCSMTCHIQATNIYLRPSNGGNFQQRGWKFPGCPAGNTSYKS